MSDDPPPTQRNIGTAILATVAAGAAVAYAVGLMADWPAWLRGTGWIWKRHVPSPDVLRVLALAAAVGIWLLVAWGVLRHLRRWSRRKSLLLLGWAIIFTPLIQLAITYQHRAQPLSASFQTTVAPTNGFFEEGVRIEDPVQFMREHAEKMPGYRGVHVRTQPPGWPVAFWAAREAWEAWPGGAEPAGRWLRRYDCTNYDFTGLSPAHMAAASLQMILLFLSGLGAIPLFLLGHRFQLRRATPLALLVYPLMPGLLVFQARLDVLYAILTLLALWLTERLIADRRGIAALPLALLLSVWTLFATMSVAVVGFVNVMLGARFLLRSERRARIFRRAALLNLLLAGFLLFLWGGTYLLWGVSWPEYFIVGRDIHHDIRVSNPGWGLFNFYELAVFGGIPLVVGAAATLIGSGRRAVRGRARPFDAWVMGWALFVALLAISGEVRAETGRLWLFLMLPALLPGAVFWVGNRPVRPAPALSPPLLTLLLGTLALQGLTAGVFLGGRPANTTSPPARWVLPDTAQPVSYQLGENIALRGYEIATGDQGLQTTLYWEATGWPQGDYAIFAHLLADGQQVAQRDGGPVDGRLPTWCWVPGEVVADTRVVNHPLDPNTKYTLAVGLYDWRTGIRLPVDPAVADEMIRLPVPR